MSEKELSNRKQELIEQMDKFVQDYNSWGYSEEGKIIFDKAMHMLATDHAIYAKMPILCKGENCIYKNDPLHKAGLVKVGEPCICETTLIAQKFMQYQKEFNLDESSYTDNVLVHELITLDLLISRAMQYINNKDYDPVIDVVTNITETGQEITQPMISKGIELYTTLVQKRDKVFELLAATRKDKIRNNVDDANHDTALINSLNDPDFFLSQDQIEEERNSRLNAYGETE